MPEKKAQPIHRQFADLATYSATERTAVSVRDGVLEYLGAELGLEPADRVFTVYRSPATIANAAYCMKGIPLTDEHVSMDGPAPNTGGRVESSIVIDQVDEPTHSRLAVQNKLAVSDSLSATMQDKRQLSLGYEADLVPHSRWDFEQVNIQPHHLAVVPAGRCGPLCSFLDRKPPVKPQEGDSMKPKKMHKAFTDAEGAVSLEQIVEIATALPEAIRKVPVDKLTEIMPALQEVMSYAKEQGAMPESDEGMEDGDMKDADADSQDEEGGEDEKKFADSLSKLLGKKIAGADGAKAAIEKHRREFADAEVKRYAEVVNKARNFLDAEYDFTGKTANQVMRDALATQSTDKFEDAELSVAFKLLRKPNTDYSQFGDAKPDGGLESRIKQSLGEE
jgi:hypothetical protein